MHYHTPALLWPTSLYALGPDRAVQKGTVFYFPLSAVIAARDALCRSSDEGRDNSCGSIKHGNRRSAAVEPPYSAKLLPNPTLLPFLLMPENG
jgi:hypothetical protein